MRCSVSLRSVKIEASGAATTLSAEATGMLMLAVMPGMMSGLLVSNLMRVEKPLMLLRMVACGAIRSTIPSMTRSVMASISIFTFCSLLMRATSAWLTCAWMMRLFRSAISITSVPELWPPVPDTAWPIDTGRDSTVQSKGARTLVFESFSSES